MSEPCSVLRHTAGYSQEQHIEPPCGFSSTSGRLTSLRDSLTHTIWKELREQRDPDKSITHRRHMLAISNSWLPPPSTSRTNIPFPQTFDPCMYCWPNNLWCYRHELLPEHFQSCSTLYVRDVFYRATYKEGINASQIRQKLNAFTSIWKISLAIFTKKELLSEILPFLWTPSA